MKSVGITGGIGTGKSHISRLFEMYGVPVLHADEVAKEIINQDLEVKSEITILFGDKAYRKGNINTKYISKMIFSDASLRQKMNAIVHPRVHEYTNQWLDVQRSLDVPYTLKEAAIMVESGANKELDFLIGVYSPMSLRLERLKNSRGYSEDYIEKVVNSQMSFQELEHHIQFRILNDEQTSLIKQVQAIHQYILAS